MTDQQDDKKIDEQWKERAEKDRQDPDTGDDDGTKVEDEAPLRASFTLLVTGIASQIVISLGETENPVTKKTEKNLDQAKYSIDVLQILEEKTKGNLTEAEERFLEGILYDMRMRYVRACG